MKTHEEIQLRKSTKRWTILFIFFLLISGLTAFPIETELIWLVEHSSLLPHFMQDWLVKIYTAVQETNRAYPQLAYGTDWLAFAHIVIAVAFIGPLIDPVKNVWIYIFGMIACIMVIPLAFICGSFRSIPTYWQLIDCSFGVFGFFPLWICYRNVLRIEEEINRESIDNRMTVVKFPHLKGTRGEDR